MADEVFRFRLDSQDAEFLRSIARSQQAVGRFARDSETRLRGLTRSFGTLRSAALSFVSVYSGIRLVRGVSDAAQGLQRIQSALVVATGSTEAARAEFEFIREESDRLGLSLATSAQEYASLAAAARGTAVEGDTTRQIFLGVAEAATALGLTAEQTGGALTAIEQIISKGRVSAEELRQQLGERLPGAFQLAARSIGVTTAELDNLLQRGALTAEDLLPNLARELRETFGPQATENADSLVATLNRLETAGFDFLNAIGRGGLAEGIADFADRLSEAADGADSAAESIGATLGTALSVAGDAALFLARNIDVIGVSVAALLALRLITYVVQTAVALRAAAAAAAGFSIALAATPIGAFAVAVAAVGGAVALMASEFGDAEDEIESASRSMARALDDIGSAASGAAGQVDQLTQATFELRQQQARLEFNQIQTEVALLNDTVNNALRLQAAAQLELGTAFDDVRMELDRLVSQVFNYGQALTAGQIPLTAFEAGLDSLGARFQALTGTVDLGRERLLAFANLYNQIFDLDVRGSQLGDILGETPPVGAGIIDDEGAVSGGGSSRRSGGSSRDRFAEDLADLQAQIDAEIRLQEAYRDSNEAVELAREETRLLTDIRRLESQFAGEQREQLVALTEELYAQARATEEVEARTSDYREAQELVRDILTESSDSASLFAAAMQALNDLLAQGKITTEQYEGAVASLNERFKEGGGIGEDLGAAVSGAFREIITDINNAESAAVSFLNRLAEIILQAAILGPLEDALTNAFSGGFGGLFGGGGGGKGIKFKAAGGPVNANEPIIVGERRPELFVPRVPGVILPQVPEMGGGGGGTVVSMPIHIDATGADPAGLARVERAVVGLQQTLPAMINNQVASGVKSGGPMAKVVGRRR